MKKFRMCVFLAVMALFGFSAVFAAPVKPLDVKIDILSGQVKVTRQGTPLEEAFTAAFPIMDGDILETQAESKAELTYNDGTKMRMKPETRVEVHAASLKIAKGNTWHQFTKRGTEFVIETPSMVAGIRGTRFDVMVNQRGKSILSVLEGKVSVKSRKMSDEVMVGAGKVTTCFVGGKPTPPIAFNTSKKDAEWGSFVADQAAKAFALDSFYQDMKKKYGDSDARTIKAKEEAEAAKNAIEGKK